jgi:hypothetical protein
MSKSGSRASTNVKGIVMSGRPRWKPPDQKRHQTYVKLLRVKIGGTEGPILTFRDRLAWALLCLMEAGQAGVAPLERPAPRWSQYILLLRQKGLVIETMLELHGGPYAGRRGRYRLRSLIEIVDREDRP